MKNTKDSKQCELKYTLKNLITPDSIEEGADRIRVHGRLNRILMAVGYPRLVEKGFLNKVISAKGDFDLTMHIHPYPIDTMLVRLNSLIKKLNVDKYSAERNGKITPSLDILMGDTHSLLELLQRGEEKLFDTSIYINVKEWDEKELEMQSKRVESSLNSVLIIPKRPVYRMKAALKSMLPTCRDALRATRTLTTSALSACFPFTTAFMDVDDSGIMLATNKDNGVPIIRDAFSFMNPNSLCVGTSGSGKSFLIKLHLIRYFMSGYNVMVVDPEGEYKDLTSAIGGQIVEISRESNTIINVLDLLGQRLDDKRLSLLSSFNMMFGNLTAPQVGILDRVVTKTYEEKGIVMGDESTWSKPAPTLGDLYNVMMRVAQVSPKKEKVSFDALLNRLGQYVNGTLSFMNKQTKIDVGNDFICFDIQKVPGPARPLMMYLILEYIHARMHKDRSRKILAVDEAWSLLGNADSAEYLFKIVKTSRKYNLALMLITQEVKDLLTTRAGDSILANTACKYFLKQDSSTIDQLVKTLNLTSEERNILLTAGVGEGIMIADKERYPIKVVASDKEAALITTNADVLHTREKRDERLEKPVEAQKESQEEGCKMMYKLSDLSEEKVRALKAEGFVQTRQQGFNTRGGSENYLIKPMVDRDHESLEHRFLVLLTEEKVREYTDDVELFQAVGPDIVFKNKRGERIAVEVETGTLMDTRLDKLEEKVERLNREYGKNWFFLVAHSDYRYKYKKYGEAITRNHVPLRMRREFV